MRVALVLSLLSSASAVDLSGLWQKSPASALERYNIDLAGVMTFNATCVDSCGWMHATITVAADNTSLHVAFDNGANHGGTLASNGAAIAWADGSGWVRMRPAGDKIIVHLCPSVHMDPGWMDTLSVLYSTLFKPSISNVTAALLANPNRTHVPEIAVLWAMYWAEADEATRDSLRLLVRRGQLEFAGGGWSQPDEAVTRVEDLVDAVTLGHMFLSSALEHAPVRFGWSADPFGHSNTVATLAALNAYDMHLLGRPMSPLDPINDVAAALWHPLSSAPDAGHFDPASTVLSASNGGYWEPYRSMRDALMKGDAAAAGKTLSAYVASAAARPPFANNVLVMFGDDAPLQSPYTSLYPALDAMLQLLNAQSATTNVTYSYSTPSAWVAARAAEVGASAQRDVTASRRSEAIGSVPGSPVTAESGFGARPAWGACQPVSPMHVQFRVP